MANLNARVLGSGQSLVIKLHKYKGVDYISMSSCLCFCYSMLKMTLVFNGHCFDMIIWPGSLCTWSQDINSNTTTVSPSTDTNEYPCFRHAVLCFCIFSVAIPWHDWLNAVIHQPNCVSPGFHGWNTRTIVGLRDMAVWVYTMFINNN